jgi:hypothetical protein
MRDTRFEIALRIWSGFHDRRLRAVHRRKPWQRTQVSM